MPSDRDCSMFPAGFEWDVPRRLRKASKINEQKLADYWDALAALASANLNHGCSTVGQCVELYIDRWEKHGMSTREVDVFAKLGAKLVQKLHFLYALGGWIRIWSDVRAGRI